MLLAPSPVLLLTGPRDDKNIRILDKMVSEIPLVLEPECRILMLWGPHIAIVSIKDSRVFFRMDMGL